MTRKLKRTTISLLLVSFFLFIGLYVYNFSVNSYNYKKHLGGSDSMFLCARSICIIRSGIKECILMKTPILVSQFNKKNLNDQTFDILFEVVNYGCN